jgi:hypothetical protein
MPPIALPSGGGGGGGGGGSSSTIKQISDNYTSGNSKLADNLFTSNARNAMLAGLDGGSNNITVNVNGGLATSADIGRAVVNSIKAMNRVDGPAQIQVA